MSLYSRERKEAVLKNLLPPFNATVVVAEIARQEEIVGHYNPFNFDKINGCPLIFSALTFLVF